MDLPNLDNQSTDKTRSTWRRFLRRAVTTTGWLVVLGVTGLLVNRYVSITQPIPILIAGLTPFAAIPLVFGGLLSIASQSWALRIATAALAGVYLVTIAPHDAVIGCGPEQHEETINIVASNVLGDGATSDDVAALILTTDADVITLSEAAPWFLDELGPLLEERLPYQSHGVASNPRGSAIFSRWPLSNIENSPQGEVRTQSANVDSPYGTFTVIAVHTQAPTDHYTTMRWSTDFENLVTLPLDSPTVLAGDFNATEDHRPFRRLLDEGWSDVHDDKGCGLDNTWPTALPDQPTQQTIPFMRLDHVLVTDHFETLAVETHKLRGSDHALVETQIRFDDNTE